MHGKKPEFILDFYNYKDSQIKPFNQLKRTLFRPHFPSENGYLSTFSARPFSLTFRIHARFAYP
jgi:hypothetical protein